MDTDIITPQEIFAQLRAIATADVTQLVSLQDGQPILDPSALSADLRAAVSAVEKTTGGVKLKFYDKLKALELLGKLLGLFDRQCAPVKSDNDLLQTILRCTQGEDSDDIPELQQAAAAGDDLVESEEIP